MIFAIIPLKHDEKQIEALSSKIKKLDVSAYDTTSPDALFISFPGSMSELAEKIGFGDDKDVGLGIILRVTHRSGYAPKTLWEWLDDNQ